jgi:hypothetical protein
MVIRPIYGKIIREICGDENDASQSNRSSGAAGREGAEARRSDTPLLDGIKVPK